jgi:hypothetical protein
VGILFIIGTAAPVLGLSFLGDIQGTLDLSKIAADESQVLIGALLLLIMAAACASTTFWLYPVLRKYDEALAIGAAGFRLIEGALMVVSALCVLVLLSLSQEYVKAGASDPANFQIPAIAIQSGFNWLFNGPILLAWCTAAVMYYYIFYRTRLIPRWLTAWGLIGIALVVISCMLVMFGVIEAGDIQSLLSFPIALQEMVMAVWLIVKGFDQVAIASLSARADSDRVTVAVNAIKQKG